MTSGNDETMPDQGANRDFAGVSPGRTTYTERSGYVGPDGISYDRDDLCWGGRTSGDSNRWSSWDVPNDSSP